MEKTPLVISPAMTNTDYPGLYRSSDAASVRAQNVYLFLQRAYLGSLVIGSGVAVFIPLASGPTKTCLYTAMAIVLLSGLFILWITRSRLDDKAWFDGRAIAESVKTATWRFMMIAPPFQSNDTVEERFVAELREIRKARANFGKHLAGSLDSSDSAITGFMRQTRAESFDQRKSFYLEARVRSQLTWYSDKARVNAITGSKWFWGTVGLQGVAVVIAVIQAVSGGLGINLLPVFTTSAAAFAAWNQMKRHEELAQAYALATQELGELEAIANNINSEPTFAQFVEQTEESISREHTMWCVYCPSHFRTTPSCTFAFHAA